MPSTAVADALMETFVIEGSQPLNGRITASGNKNGALPILAGCLLTDEPVTLRNVPRIRDVETMVELLVRLGPAAFARRSCSPARCSLGPAARRCRLPAAT